MNAVLIAQIVLSVAVCALILIQSKGVGIGRAWGSGAKSFTRRGLEKMLFKLTFVVSGLFILISLLGLVL